MNTTEYLEVLEEKVEQVLGDVKFNNHRNQLSAWKLSAAFNRSYSEEYLWNRALFLSTSGCQILQHGNNPRLAGRILRESALIYENFFHVSESYDRNYAVILSALCYDLSGYQANAVCLMKKISDYEFETDDNQVDLSSENYLLKQLRSILLKNITFANTSIDTSKEVDLGVLLLNNALAKWYAQILRGVEYNLSEDFELAYRYFLGVFNLPVSQLLGLLKTRVQLYFERSIWQNLKKIEGIRDNSVWDKYIKLLANDVYDGRAIKSIEKRLSKFEFWTSQLRAIQKGVLTSDSSFVVQMPTSAGKTFIAELSILNSLVNNPGQRCLYISPFRALTNEKEADLSDNLSKLGYSVSALSGNYEIDEFQEIILADTDVLIATPEKIDLLLRLNPAYFSSVALAVVDEGHILGDISPRSSLLEFLIIRLRLIKENLKILFISAVMPPSNADEYSIWLSGSADKVIRSSLHQDSPPNEEWEPTRKLIGSFTWEGNNGRISYKNMPTEDEETKQVTQSFIPAIIKKRQYGKVYPDGNNKAQTSAALAFRLSEEGNTLVFCAQVRDTDRVGTALLNILAKLREVGSAIPDWFSLNTDRESYFYARRWFGENSYITKCLSYGIGIHFGDLPEAVRRSVEEDFVKGNLRVLISTNTIGQGLNFPIKNLIFHSTIITFAGGKIVDIEVRDFWNIIGRAGRAGMETEGQIIFNIKTYSDQQAFDKYTNRNNIAPAYSIFFNVLAALVAGRINQQSFEHHIKLLSEPYILNLIAEEAIGTVDEEIINKILGKSLFQVQALERGFDVQPIITSFRSIFAAIKDENSAEQIRVFGETGLCLKTNQVIDAFVTDNRDLIADIIDHDNYLALIEIIYQLFDGFEIEELKSDKLDKLTMDFSVLFAVTTLWIQGAEIDELQAEWAAVSENPAHLNLLIADGFYYRFPWLISSFLTISNFKLGIEKDKVGLDISKVVSYVKYGLNNGSACLLKSMGIKNRETALILADLSGGLEARNIIRWMANLSIEEIQQMEVSVFDRQNILNTSLKLTPNRFEAIQDFFTFAVKGISYQETAKVLSRQVIEGLRLSYRRDFANSFDPFAIAIYVEDIMLGYVPREFAKMISVEIDISGFEYEIIIELLQDNIDYNDVIVTMRKL